jgi:hypothetical protein
MAIHHVEMEYICPCGFDDRDLISEVREIRRQ